MGRGGGCRCTGARRLRRGGARGKLQGGPASATALVPATATQATTTSRATLAPGTSSVPGQYQGNQQPVMT
eukprot:1569157-Rhodomonas_salina.1